MTLSLISYQKIENGLHTIVSLPDVVNNEGYILANGIEVLWFTKKFVWSCSGISVESVQEMEIQYIVQSTRKPTLILFEFFNYL